MSALSPRPFHRVIVRMTKEDFDQICEAANAIGVSVNSFIGVAAHMRAEKVLDDRS